MYIEDVVLHDHSKQNSKMIAKLIQEIVGEDATIKVKIIIKITDILPLFGQLMLFFLLFFVGF